MSWSQLPDSLPMSGAPGSEPNCCKNPYDIGCIDYCADIDLKTVVAPVTGIYKFEATLPSGKLVYFKHFVAFDIIILPPPPIESGDVSIAIKKPPNGEYIKFQLTETVLQVCNAPLDVNIVYDCLRYNVSIARKITAVINEPCSGTETVNFTGLYLLSRKGAIRANPIKTDTIYITNGVKEIYAIAYEPLNGCKPELGTISIMPPIGFVISDIENIVLDGQTPYIQFKIEKTSFGNEINPIGLGISGLCNNCIALIYPTLLNAYDCANPADFIILGLFDADTLVSNPYTIPEDIAKASLTLQVFRQCCKEKITVSAVILSTTDPAFTITDGTIEKTKAELSIEYNAPLTPFTAQVQFTLTACSQTHVFVQDFQRL